MRSNASLGRVGLALLLVYVIWGSTYLGIRYAVETLPVLLYAGARFLVAGAVLYAIVRLRGSERASGRQWRDAAIVGALLLLAGNGLISFAERTVPSGITAVLVAMVPLWIVLMEWWRTRARPTPPVIIGVLLGLAGVALLVGPADVADTGRIDPAGAAMVLVSGICWAAGSLYSRHADVPRVPLLATAMQQLAGGALLLVAGTLTGELGTTHPETFSMRSLVALGYLIVFGSLVGFTAYIWLMRNVAPAVVSTYAYVNPVIAVLLGWALASEPITARTLLASAIVVGAVALITTEQARLAMRERRERDAGAATAAK